MNYAHGNAVAAGWFPAGQKFFTVVGISCQTRYRSASEHGAGRNSRLALPAADPPDHHQITSTVTADGRTRTYRVEGKMFYGSVEDFMATFDFREALGRVIIDITAAHIWDISSVQALDMAMLKFRRDGA